MQAASLSAPRFSVDSLAGVRHCFLLGGGLRPIRPSPVSIAGGGAAWGHGSTLRSRVSLYACGVCIDMLVMITYMRVRCMHCCVQVLQMYKVASSNAKLGRFQRLLLYYAVQRTAVVPRLYQRSNIERAPTRMRPTADESPPPLLQATFLLCSVQKAQRACFGA